MWMQNSAGVCIVSKGAARFCAGKGTGRVLAGSRPWLFAGVRRGSTVPVRLAGDRFVVMSGKF